MTRAALIDMAVVRMDELMPFAQSLVVSGGNDVANPARAYADECVNEAMNDVLKVCAMRFVVNANIGAANAAAGAITLPSDYLRAVSLTTGNGVQIEISPEGSAVHLQQKHGFASATASKPAAVLLSTNTIQLYGELYATLRYVKKVSGTAWNTDSICHSDLLPAIAWQCAGKALAVMGDARAKNAMELAALQIT